MAKKWERKKGEKGRKKGEKKEKGKKRGGKGREREKKGGKKGGRGKGPLRRKSENMPGPWIGTSGSKVKDLA